MAKKSNDEKYTDPELREKLKEEITASDKGGEPAQWSARKSQLLTQEYEKHGGGYRGEKDEDQKDLERWTDEEWRTREGDARARGDGETARYLPREAWENMSEEERRETDRKKREGSRRGEQYVENTDEAKQAREEAQAPPIEGYDELTVEEISARLDGLSRDELAALHAHEKRTKDRKTLVGRLESRLDGHS